MSRLTEPTLRTLAKATELALTSSERIRRSLELLGSRAGATIGDVSEDGSAVRPAIAGPRRSAPPPAGA